MVDHVIPPRSPRRLDALKAMVEEIDFKLAQAKVKLERIEVSRLTSNPPRGVNTGHLIPRVSSGFFLIW